MNIERVDRGTLAEFRRYAVLRLQLADSTLRDTIRKLAHMANRALYGDIAINLLADESVLEQEVEIWLFHRLNEGLSKTGVNNYIKAINRWSQYRDYNIHFDLYPEQTGPVFTPSPLQVKRCIDACMGRNPVVKRDKCMIVVLAASGLRISELVNLELSDIDYERCTILVRRGKGGKSRLVHVDKKVIRGRNYPSILNYVEYHRFQSHRSALFTSEEGEMTVDYARKRISLIGERAGVPRIHPHAFRRFFAVTLLRAGVHEAIIQRELGHESLATTDRYLRGLTEYDVEAAMRSVHIPDPLTVAINYRSMKHRNGGVLASVTGEKLNGPGGIHKDGILESYRELPVLGVPLYA